MSRDPFVSYAQNCEDVVLARVLRPDEHAGFWIDVGASDPIVSSVTAAFSERGWRGINIEPVADDYERLCEARPDDINLQVALGAHPGKAKLFEAPPESRGLSTLVPELADSYRAQGEVFVPVEVTVTTLSDVVAEHAPDVVDFLKIDVEGFELEVIQGTDWSRFQPRIIVIEATEPNDTQPSYEKWEPIILANGYRFALFDGLNRFYARDDEPELCDALSVPANILDDFVPHVWSEQARRAVAGEEVARVAEAGARHRHDLAAIALEEVAELRDDLDAAQHLTAHALSELDAARRETADARGEAERLGVEVEALRNTRLYRYTNPFRRAYGRLVRRSRRRSG